MSDPEHVKEVNAVFDELWAERNAQIAKLPAMFQGMAQGFSPRAEVLATAYKVVAAVDKARGST
jgi:hypothetical protein